MKLSFTLFVLRLTRLLETKKIFILESSLFLILGKTHSLQSHLVVIKNSIHSLKISNPFSKLRKLLNLRWSEEDSPQIERRIRIFSTRNWEKFSRVINREVFKASNFKRKTSASSAYFKPLYPCIRISVITKGLFDALKMFRTMVALWPKRYRTVDPWKQTS